MDDSGIEFNLSTGFETLLIDDIEKVDVTKDSERLDTEIVWFFSDEEFIE